MLYERRDLLREIQVGVLDTNYPNSFPSFVEFPSQSRLFAKYQDASDDSDDDGKGKYELH